MEQQEIKISDFKYYGFLPDPLIIFKVTGEIIYVNNAFEEKFLIKENIITGSLISSLFLIESLDFIQRISKSNTLEIDAAFREFSELSKVRLKLRKFDYSNDTELFIATCEPAKELNVLHKDILAEKHYFKQLLESVPFGMVVLNEKDQVIDTNNGFLTLFNYKAEAVKGRYINDLIVPERMKSDGSAISEAVYSGETVIKETQRQRSDGSIVDVSVTGIPIFTEKGERRVFGIYQDIRYFLEIRNQIEKEKKHFHSLFKNLPFGAVLLNEKEQIVDCNDALVQMFQFSHEEFLAANGMELIIPNEFLSEGKKLRNNALSGEKVYKETIRKRKDGSLIQVAITANRLLSSDGSSMVFGFFQDISSRKVLESSLADQQRMLTAMVQFLPGMMYRCDATMDYNMIFASFGSQRVTGYLPEDFVKNGKTFNSIILNEWQDKLWLKWTECIDKQLDFEAEYQIYAKDGSVRWVWERGRPVFGSNGEVLYLEGYIEDVTDRRHMQDSLKRERDLLQSLMDNIPDTIYFKDLNSRFIRVNKAQAKTLGLTDPSQAIGGTDADFFDNHHAEIAMEDEKRLMRTGISLVSKQEYIKTSNGWRWFTASKVPLRDAAGKIIGLAGVSRDITDLKHLEEKLIEKESNLRQSNTEKDKLFSVIAHDLRSPFNSFLLLTEILAEDSYDIDSAELKNLANSMHRAAKSVAELLENLLSWSGIQRGTIHFVPEFIKMEEIILKNLNYYQTQLNIKSIRVEMDVQNKLIVFTDAGMLGTALRNLISNAIKFTAHEGSIKIEVLLEGLYARVSVVDNGIGMAQDYINQLFAVETTGRKGTDGEPSSGLGLILVKDFVERMGGKLTVKSTIGLGSTFSFTIPVSKV